MTKDSHVIQVRCAGQSLCYYGIQMDFFFAFLLASAPHCTPCGEGMVSFLVSCEIQTDK